MLNKLHVPLVLRHTLLFVYALAAFCPQLAEDYRFEHLTDKDGLSENSVMAIHLDSQGFLWFGTGDGLNRYDGYQFKTFRNIPGDSSSIGSNYVVAIGEDNNNNLWLGTWQGGLNRFNRERETFTRFGNGAGQIPGLSDDSALSFLHDRHNRLWVGTIRGGLNLIDPVTGEASSFLHNSLDPTSIGHNVIPCLAEDSSGKIWIGTGAGGLNRLMALDTTDKGELKASFMRYQHDPADPQSISHNAVVVIRPDPLEQQILWVATREGGVCRFDSKTGRFTRLMHEAQNTASLSSDQVYSMLFDQEMALWIGTFGGGLNRMVRGSGVFSRFQQEPGNPHSLNDDKIISIAEDRSGNLWFGTHKAGINKLNLRANRFQNYTSNTSSSIPLPGDFITAVYEARDKVLWVGSDRGLTRLDRIKNTSRSYQHKSQDKKSISHNWVYSILEDEADNFWIGTYGGGLNRMNRINHTFQRFQHNPNDQYSLGDDRVLTLTDDERYLWIGTRGGGFNRFDPVAGQFARYLPNPADSNSLSDFIVRDIFRDEYNLLWLATNAGLNRFDPVSESFRRFYHDPDDSTSISDNRILTIADAGSNHIWIGTMNGLNRYDHRKDRFQRYYRDDGLANNVIYAIVKGQQGNFWISTNRGIARFDPATESFINFDEKDGLLNNEFNFGAATVGSEGELFFGGNSGLDYFHPMGIVPNDHRPPVVLTDFLLFNRPVRLTAETRKTPLQKVISQTKAITLSHEDKVFSFQFSALDFSAPTRNRYAYRMEGFDDHWIPAGGKRFATYTNLDPGQYRFRVRASNNSGVWNNKGAAIDIMIRPPFWKTTWFRLGMLALLTGLLFLIYRLRVDSLLQVERTRTTIARDLHDELSATLSSINFFSQAIEADLNQKVGRNTQKYLGLIEESSRVAQEKIHDIIWTIDSDNDSWADVLAKCRRFSAELLEAQNIRHQQNIPSDLKMNLLSMDQRRNFWLIFKELVTNIGRHSQAMNAVIKIGHKDREIKLEVSDDGIGFDPELASHRNGLKNIYSRAREINAVVNLQTAPGNGTRWRISFKV